MKFRALLTSMVALTAFPSVADDHGFISGYVLADQGSTLIVMDTLDMPGKFEAVNRITINGVAADLMPMGGLDIVSPREGDNMAFAVLQLEGEDGAGLYAINLDSGVATLKADHGMGGISGFEASMK